MQTFDATKVLASELSLAPTQINAVLSLFEQGNTVPFIARYRKEATGSLDEVQIRAIQDRHQYLRELEERRAAILQSIDSLGKLTGEIKAALLACTTKSELEDLYLPFRPKRRTRAAIAKERGLLPLAERIWIQPAQGDPNQEALAFVNAEKGVLDLESALAGARDILAELAAETAHVRAWLRGQLQKEGCIVSQAVPDKAQTPTKFEQWYDFQEKICTIPSHRFLALLRGQREEVLKVRLELDEATAMTQILSILGNRPDSPFGEQMQMAVADGYARLLFPSLETEVLADLKLASDQTAVEVFASNLKNLLMAPPLGAKPVLGIDPGLRTGCKCAALDATGNYLDFVTIYPSQGEAAAQKAKEDLATFVRKHQPMAIAVGNGTAGRETETMVRATLERAGSSQVMVVMVSESGASVYSASDVAREEFPDQDVTVRGAISIGRRLQDPLAELVKIDPKSIGVGQYQHDVHQALLARKLDDVVESCVNQVGVELNTASALLLSRVAGIGPKLAQKLVEHRQEHGAFGSRMQLRKVAGMGPKTFEQAAGFLRIRGGESPLDASAVHPERYDLVQRIASDLGVTLAKLVGDPTLAEGIDKERYLGDGVGEPTLKDIVDELKKPGRDPRDRFDPVRFREDVHELSDLTVGMALEGVITNVTAFGAFVDVGVHRDGLVHLSQLSDRFVQDPRQVVKVGDKIKVRVLEVDLERKRLSLTAKSGEAPKPMSGIRPRESKQAPEAQRQGKPGTAAGGSKKSEFHNNPFSKLLKH